MQHVDEGILHAYLDGAVDALADAGALPAGVSAADVEAHLRGCEHCRVLLERERALRGDAAVVLGHARLEHVETPAWELRAGRPAAVAPRRRLLPMAWAASVLLAVGAGWWGSELWRTELESGQESQPLASQDAPLESSAAAAHVPVEQARIASEPGFAAGSPRIPAVPDIVAPAPAVIETQGAREMADRIAAEVGSVDIMPPRIPAGEPVMASAARLRVDSAPALQTDARSGVTVPGTMSLMNAGAPPVAQRTVPLPAQRGSQAASAPPPTSRQQRAQAEPLVRVPLPVELFREAVTEARRGGLNWYPRTQQSIAGGLLVVAGAPYIDVSSAAAPTGGELLRVTHQLADGTPVEILQWREPEAGTAQRMQPGASVATVVVQASEAPAGGRELLLRAPMLGLYVLITADLDARQLLALGDALILSR